MQKDWHWVGSWRQLASCVGLGRGEGLCEEYGCGRRAGTERFLCLCLGGHVGQVGFQLPTSNGNSVPTCSVPTSNEN